jgi:hypothetical protein
MYKHPKKSAVKLEGVYICLELQFTELKRLITFI